jgi:hypothetical protein
VLAAFARLRLRQVPEGVEPEIWVNVDLAVSMRRSDDRTLIDFVAPARPATGMSLAEAPRRIEVVETPDQIIEIMRAGWTTH